MDSAKQKSEKPMATRKVGRHKVRDAIEKMILEGRFRPGEKLVQLQLSRMFNVSLGMVRESLFELQRSGLIETIDNRGVFVRRLDEQVIREFYTIRELFEGLAARDCCGRLKPKEATELRALTEEIYQLAIAGQEREKALVDRKFHNRIVEISGNSLLVGMSQQYRVLGKIASTNSNPEKTRDSHLGIVDAIEKGDPELSERLSREHVRNGLKEIEQRITRAANDIIWVT